jgi:hypothetical protein
MTHSCPWSGLPCDCDGFPWLTHNAVIPPQCEEGMPEELLGRRPVSAEGKARYKAYVAEMKA